MKSAFSLILVTLGLALGGFAANIAFRGAEPPVPGASASIEGEILPGATTQSPVGAPFAYGEIRVQDADDAQSSAGTVHWRGSFGEPNVRLRTSRGEVRVHLPPPARWRSLDEADETLEVASLEGLPIVANIDVGERITPPYRVTAHVVRAGDHVVVAKDRGARVGLYVGTRAEHVAFRARRESGRWPVVALLSLMSVISVYAARRVVSGSFFDDVPDDEDQPAT